MQLVTTIFTKPETLSYKRLMNLAVPFVTRASCFVKEFVAVPHVSSKGVNSSLIEAGISRSISFPALSYQSSRRRSAVQLHIII